MKTLERRARSLLHYATAMLFVLTPVLSGTATGGPQTWVPLRLGALMAGVTFAAKNRFGSARSVRSSTRQNLELAGRPSSSFRPGSSASPISPGGHTSL
jgi:hypothetical protein